MLLFFSCQGEGKTGFIQGQISNAGGKTLFLDELTSQSINPKDSIKLDDSGKFSFNPDIKEPGFFRVRIDQNNFALIFLEPGQPLKITADAANLGKTYQIQENEENRKLSEATKFLIKNGERGDSLNQVANSNPNLMSDTLLLKKLQSRFEEIKNNEILYIKKYVKENASSLTCIALIDRISPETDFEVYRNLDAGLMKKYPQSSFTKDFHTKVEGLSKLAIGSPAPNIELENPEGTKIALSSLKGKVVLIDFWASWCRPCRMENPNVVRLYKEYKDKGFEVYGVSLDKSKDDWIKAIKDDGLSWTHVSDLGFWQSSVVKLYNITGIPQTYLVDKDGKIIGKGLRGEELEKKLKQVLVP
jgi:peroxiredoxin